MSRHASGRGGAAREPTWQASQGQACAVVLGSGGAGPPGLSAVASGARAGEAVAIGGGGGAGGRGGLLQARLSRRRPVAGREGKVWAVAFRPGHGSGASESVHRGLRELVSGGRAARAPPPGSLFPPRPSVARPRRAVGTGHPAPHAGWQDGQGTAHLERPPGGSDPGGTGAACPRWAAWKGDTAHPRAPVCAASARRPPARQVQVFCSQY